jgi:hypothetical protein
LALKPEGIFKKKAGQQRWLIFKNFLGENISKGWIFSAKYPIAGIR